MTLIKRHRRQCKCLDCKFKIKNNGKDDYNSINIIKKAYLKLIKKNLKFSLIRSKKYKYKYSKIHKGEELITLFERPYDLVTCKRCNKLDRADVGHRRYCKKCLHHITQKNINRNTFEWGMWAFAP